MTTDDTPRDPLAALREAHKVVHRPGVLGQESWCDEDNVRQPCDTQVVLGVLDATRPSGDDFPDPALDRVNDEDCFPSGDEALRVDTQMRLEHQAHRFRDECAGCRALAAVDAALATPSSTPDHVHNWQRGYGVTPYCHDCGIEESTPDVEGLRAVLEYGIKALGGADRSDLAHALDDLVHAALRDSRS